MPTALPDFVSEISGMLVALLPVAALGAMVLAGLRLRGEGGINYDAGGGFFKWLFWGALLLTLPAIFSATIPGLFTGGPAPIPPSGAGTGSFGSVATSITTGITSFVNNVLVGRIVPLMAAALYFKSILDSSEGHSPLPSLISISLAIVLKRTPAARIFSGSFTPCKISACLLALPRRADNLHWNRYALVRAVRSHLGSGGFRAQGGTPCKNKEW